jgi:hypothetical protein
MRRLVTWLLVTLGIAALVRRLRRQKEPEWAPEPVTPTTAPASAEPTTPSDTVSQGSSAADIATEAEPPAQAEGDPAAELRERLARSRADMPSSEEESVEERRASVHEQGRAALDEMQPSSKPSAPPADEEQ